MSKIDTVQEQSIPLSAQVPCMHFGTMWAHNPTIYLGPSELEPNPLLRNGVRVGKTEIVSTNGSGIQLFSKGGRNYQNWTGSSDWDVNEGLYLRNNAGVRDTKLDSLFKLDVERNVGTNETSSIGDVNLGKMVPIKSVGQKGSKWISL